MIKQVTVKGAMAKRIALPRITFQPGPNIIVGPNGSGKTSLFHLLLKPTKQMIKECKIDFKRNTWYWFDFEKDNPRRRGYIKTGYDIVSRFHSHGESNKAILSMLKNNPEIEGCCLFLDEPEQALDLDGIEMFLTIIKQSKAQQIMIITHHPSIILHPGFNIIEMEKGYKQKVANHIKSLCEQQGEIHD